MSRITGGYRRGSLEGSSEHEPRPFEMREANIYQLPLLKGLNVSDWLTSLKVPDPGGSTLQRIKAGLRALRARGHDGLLISGIHPTGQERAKGVGSLFSITNHTKVDERLGTLEHFRQLIQVAHQLGLAVGLELVLNHTAWDSNLMKDPKTHHYFVMENRSISPGLYTWMGNDTQRVDEFSDVAQLDHSQPEVREELAQWVETLVSWGVDFFRVDMAAQMLNRELAHNRRMRRPYDGWLTEIMERARTAGRLLGNKIFFLGESNGELSPFELGYVGLDAGTSKAPDQSGADAGYYDALVQACVTQDPRRLAEALNSLARMKQLDSAAGVVSVASLDSPAPRRAFGKHFEAAIAFTLFLRPLLWVASTEGGFDYEGDRNALGSSEQTKAWPLDAHYSLNFQSDPKLLARNEQRFHIMNQVVQGLGGKISPPLPLAGGLGYGGDGWVGYEIRSADDLSKPGYLIILNPTDQPVKSPLDTMIPAGECWLVNLSTKQTKSLVVNL